MKNQLTTTEINEILLTDTCKSRRGNNYTFKCSYFYRTVNRLTEFAIGVEHSLNKMFGETYNIRVIDCIDDYHNWPKQSYYKVVVEMVKKEVVA